MAAAEECESLKRELAAAQEAAATAAEAQARAKAAEARAVELDAQARQLAEELAAAREVRRRAGHSPSSLAWDRVVQVCCSACIRLCAERVRTPLPNVPSQAIQARSETVQDSQVAELQGRLAEGDAKQVRVQAGMLGARCTTWLADRRA